MPIPRQALTIYGDGAIPEANSAKPNRPMMILKVPKRL